jgi:uncharacterized protein
MEVHGLIDAARAGDLAAVKNHLASGADVNVTCEQGWSPLNYAAGRGDLEMVKLLVTKGAEIFRTGRDNRTAYMIALAAGRAEVARYLREVEDASSREEAKSLRPQRQYCKAYNLEDLRQFPSWSEARIDWKDDEGGRKAGEPDGGAMNDKIVFLHQDFTVTRSMWHNENVIFNRVDSEWRDFCVNILGFKSPDDLDLLVPPYSTGATV